MRYLEKNEVIFASLDRVKFYLESLIINKIEYSSYSDKLIDIIIGTFPKRTNENDISKELNISARYLQKICKECFNRNFNRLLRRIRVYIALCLMDKTSFEDKEISLNLDYSEVSSMRRDFMKELRYSPDEARELLKTKIPKELMFSSFN